MILSPRSSSLRRASASLVLVALTCACSQTPEAEAPPPPATEPESEPAAWVPGPSVTDIQQAVRVRNADLRQCYLAGTFKNAQLAGTVNVLFTIDTQGKVSEAADAGSDIPDPEVVSCVLDVFGQLEFAAGSTTDTQVEYPVKFGQHG